jgi:general secretion pathway protein F
MPSFHYQAYDAHGTLAQGRIEALSSEAASEALWAQGLTAFELEHASDSSTPWWRRELFGSGVGRADLVSFTRELATLAGAGIPLDDCLRMLADKATSRAARALIAEVRQEVLNGATLSDALRQQRRFFSEDYVNIVRAGEAAGALARVFDELAALLERRQEVRSKVQSALVYPGILLALSAVSLAVIIGVLIPSIAPVFAQGGKPLPSAIQFFLDLQAHWLDVLLGVAIAGAMTTWMVTIALRRPAIRLGLDRLKLALPMAGALLLQQETARFSRTLGTLLRAGVPLLQAATSACGGTANRHLAAGLDRAVSLVREGASLHRALGSETTLPPIALRMIAIGEEAGKLDHMLLTTAGMFEQQTQRTIDRLMTLLTPLLTVGIAGLVGTLILTVMNAILSINEIAVR